MGNELKLNSAEEAEVILIRLTPEEYPIAYANKVKCLMLSGLSKKEAERMAMEPIDLELYYEVGVGLMAVESGAVEAVDYLPGLKECSREEAFNIIREWAKEFTEKYGNYYFDGSYYDEIDAFIEEKLRTI